MKTEEQKTKVFPENENTLFQEMTEHMPQCYFTPSLNDEDTHQFVNKEFIRIRELICHEYKFDKDKYSKDKNNTSPFDFVCDSIRHEINTRIRYDHNLAIVNGICKSLIKKIQQAVEKENNIIGTFYKNQGRHFQDNETDEYNYAPLVAICHPGYPGYGGYEGNTVHELFINNDGELICTLYGVDDKYFDEPIQNVQVEGLIEIEHWLEEYEFIKRNELDDDILVCAECGSLKIQQQTWFNPNTHEYISETECDKDDNWCDECQQHYQFYTLKEFKERLQMWWEETDLANKTDITGYRQCNFSMENSNQDFVGACNKWWNDKSYEEQRKIWVKYNIPMQTQSEYGQD